MSRNRNHPSTGARITVEPIRDPKNIKTIKRLFKDKPRDLLLFVMGINNGLRAGDLLKLKVGQVRNLKPGQSILIREGKTGKVNVLMMNWSTHKVLLRYLEGPKPAEEDYLFKSAKGKNRPLTTSSVNNLIRVWCRAVNLQGNYGDHSLRVTLQPSESTFFGKGGMKPVLT